ncbi:myo-inositol-1(or 4)-monophosphatase, partial [Phenoliferia sp. Uapishka_3]
MTSPPDFERILNFAIKLARSAGDLILAASSARSSQSSSSNADASKKNRVDRQLQLSRVCASELRIYVRAVVTETDQAVEKFIKEAIEKEYPTHSFIGEESHAAGEVGVLTSNPTWIVDPIDGTFVHFFPQVCISIGFTFDKKPAVGVIFNPFLNQLYSARKGHGAYLNESIRLPLSYPNPLALDSISDALIGVEWGSDRRKSVIEKKARTFSRLAGDGKEIEGAVMAHSLRSIGSAALNYSYVAAGQLDIYWEIGCWSWDVCAGTIIAREAGAKVYGRGGKAWEDEDLMGHYFFVVRAIGDTSKESGEVAQDRIAKEFFGCAEDWDAVSIFA